MFIVKLDIQTGGDVNLALAIAQNMSLSTIAYVLLLSLLPYLAAGVAVGSGRVHFNLEFSGGVRRVAGWACWVAVLILLWSQPWWYLALALALVTLERVTEGREPGPRSVSLEQWAKSAAPEDSDLRRYWSALRKLLRGKGHEISPERGDIATPELDTMSWVELASAVTERFSRIHSVRRKTPMSAVYMSIIAIFTAFGITVITGPIRLAPTEHVTFSDGASLNGYLFSTSPDQSLFVDTDMSTSRYVVPSEIRDRVLCAPAPSFVDKTVFSFFSKRAVKRCAKESESATSAP
jgi:hypothetical protein